MEQVKLKLWRPTESMYDKDGNDFKKTNEGSDDSFVNADSTYAIAKAVTDLKIYRPDSWGVPEVQYDPNATGTQYVRVEDVITMIYGLTHDLEPRQKIVIDKEGQLTSLEGEQDGNIV